MRLVLAVFSCLSASGATVLDTAPLRFEPNPRLEAQWGEGSPVKWSARGPGYAFLFADRGTFIRTSAGSVMLTFPGAKKSANFAGEKPLNTKINYFVGHKYAGVQGFKRLRRAAIWPGIDVVYYGDGHDIEYDFEIAPGADPSRIRMRFEGAKSVRLNDRGEIVLDCGAGEITQRKPVVYQRRASGEIVAIDSRYVLHGRLARLKLAGYDPRRALTIDPTITYSAYLSGENVDSVVSVGHDPTGKVYLAGNTFSLEFPVTQQAYQSTPPLGPQHVWVAQIDPTAGANAVLYCSYIGGQSTDIATQMVVDPDGVMYITGQTDSTNYPSSVSAYNATYAGSNSHPFVTMLDPSQPGANGLIYSTYFGGTTNNAGNASSDQGNGIAIANGKIYVTGWTTSVDLPVTANAYQSTLTSTTGNNAWVAEFDPTQYSTASLLNCTYLGGSNDDEGNSIVVDSTGLAYIGGQTGSPDFPITSNANQQGFGAGAANGFLAVMNLNAGTLNYSTYLGGSVLDSVKRIALTPSPGNIALTGYTLSPDFPVTFNGYQTTLNGPGNAFLSILNTSPAVTPGQGLLYSTFFGGSGGEVAYDLRVDPSGRMYLGGYTLSPDFPVTANAMYSSSVGGSIDGFVAVLDPSQPPAGQLVYSTYITGEGTQIVYGIDIDTAGTIYVTGETTGNVFPNSQPPNTLVLKTTVFVMTFTLP